MRGNQRTGQESLEEGYDRLKAQLMQYLDLRDRPYGTDQRGQPRGKGRGGGALL